MKDYTVKPIQTKYRGQWFRSRLEVRWAIFFDALGVKWEYEKEGYVLPDKSCYLPDFWLPQVNMWAEVKPQPFTLSEYKKAIYLVKGTEYPLLMLIGIPRNHPYYAIINGSWYYRPGNRSMGTATFCLTMYGNYPIDEHRFYSYYGYMDRLDVDAFHEDTEIAASIASRIPLGKGEVTAFGIVEHP